MANTNTSDGGTEGASYGALERFLIWFLIPVVFTTVLLGVLFYILGFDVLGGVQRALHSIPVIGQVIPEPKDKTPGGEPAIEADATDKSLKQRDELIAELNAKISDLESKTQLQGQTSTTQDQVIKELTAKNTELEEKIKAKTLTDEEYTAQIKELASIYAKMAPSKAAPILENLTVSETVLVLSNMKQDERVKILEKMDAKKAAEASIGLKDVKPLKDIELEALRERLALNMVDQVDGQDKTLTRAELGQTFAAMDAKSAASILHQLYGASPTKVVAIVTAMDAGSRARVMSALTELNKDTAAGITSRLTQ